MGKTDTNKYTERQR